MQTAYEIKKLCESWWEDLADATREEQQRFASRFLQLLGWGNVEPLEASPAGRHPSTLSYILRPASQPAIATHFVIPGSLESPGALVERCLDFCETARSLVDATRAFDLRYCFVTDLFRSYLYDTRTEELLLYADSPADFQREFGDVMSSAEVAQGALDGVRRQPRSYLARQLREWSHRWCESLAREIKSPTDLAALAVDRLFVLRFLVDQGILKRTGWRIQERFLQLLLQAAGRQPEGCGKRLTALFHDAWLDWKAGLFAPEPKLDDVLEKDAISTPLLREFLLLSRTKFDLLTILESFNYGEATEKARVRMIPEENEERKSLLARLTLDTIDDARVELDLEDEGYRAIFHWFDCLATAYERLGKEFDADSHRRQDPTQEMDLFAWSEINAARPDALTDCFRHMVEKGLVIYYTSPRQYRTARLLLHLHLISRYREAKSPFAGFPRVEAALHRRPRLLESDRKRIYESPQTDHWDAV